MNTFNSITVNQINTTFLLGTDTGFTMYRVNPLEKLSERALGGGIAIAVQLYDTNIIGLVGGGDNPAYPVNQFILWNDLTQAVISTKVEKDRILAVRINHDVVAIVMKKRTVLYKLDDMTRIRKIQTCLNPDGVCDLGPKIVLCPSIEVGSVNVVTYANPSIPDKLIKCCSHPLKCISLINQAFAVASIEGTLIRVFDFTSGTLIKELRRGSDSCDIYTISVAGDYLLSTSSKGTIHVFSLTATNPSSRASFLGGYFGSEWSSLSLDYHRARPNIGKSNTTPSVTPKHTALLIQSTYILVLSVDGTYAIHDVNIKERKSSVRVIGALL